MRGLDRGDDSERQLRTASRTLAFMLFCAAASTASAAPKTDVVVLWNGDRMTGEIKNVIEALLTIDYELRRVQNLKLAFDSRAGQGGD